VAPVLTHRRNNVWFNLFPNVARTGSSLPRIVTLLITISQDRDSRFFIHHKSPIFIYHELSFFIHHKSPFFLARTGDFWLARVSILFKNISKFFKNQAEQTVNKPMFTICSLFVPPFYVCYSFVPYMLYLCSRFVPVHGLFTFCSVFKSRQVRRSHPRASAPRRLPVFELNLDYSIPDSKSIGNRHEIKLFL
jgi:hypothetical protein